MKMTVIPIMVGALGIVPKGMEKRIEELKIRGKIETIQTTALRSPRLLKRILDT